MDEFTNPKSHKILNSFALKEMFYQESITKMRHLKRIRLGEDIQMLTLPRYERKMATVKKLDPSVSKKKLVKV